jgi:hypothetical protein
LSLACCAAADADAMPASAVSLLCTMTEAVACWADIWSPHGVLAMLMLLNEPCLVYFTVLQRP